MNVFKYELKLYKGIKVSLPNIYSVYIPSQSILSGYITNISLREFLVLIGLIINEGYKFNIDFSECKSELEWFDEKILINEDINGREHQMELFIKNQWGFYSTEMIIKEWVDLIIDMIQQYNESFVT